MRVRDVMTSPVITLQARTPLQPAAALLVAHGFTGLRWSTATGRSSAS
jgi:CBS domain-containing protein